MHVIMIMYRVVQSSVNRHHLRFGTVFDAISGWLPPVGMESDKLNRHSNWRKYPRNQNHWKKRHNNRAQMDKVCNSA